MTFTTSGDMQHPLMYRFLSKIPDMECLRFDFGVETEDPDDVCSINVANSRSMIKTRLTALGQLGNLQTYKVHNN